MSHIEKAKGGEIEIARMIVCSTSHITAESAKWLKMQGKTIANEAVTDLHMAASSYGWLICCRQWAENEKPNDLPNDLTNVLEFARKNDADWINIDCDGPEIETLPTYDW